MAGMKEQENSGSLKHHYSSSNTYPRRTGAQKHLNQAACPMSKAAFCSGWRGNESSWRRTPNERAPVPSLFLVAILVPVDE